MSELPPAPPPQPPAPLATYALLAINIGVFVAMVVSGISVMNPTTRDLIRWGADFGPLTLTGEPWRAITSAFLHVGLIHLALNMWCLLNLGRMLEMIIGAWGVLLAYVATGIGAAVASLSWNPLRTSAGASGSIFGIAGILIAVLYLAFPRDQVRPLLMNVVQFAGINLVYGFLGNIDNMAHLGGLISGLLIGAALSRTLKNVVMRTAILVCAIAIAAALLIPLRALKADIIHLYQAEVALDRRDFKTAISLAQSYITKKPNDAEGHATLGYALHDAQRFPEAIREYERALALKPVSPDVEINLAMLDHKTRRLDDAIKHYSNALPDLPPNAEYDVAFAKALFDRQRFGEAETQLRKAIALDPKNAEAHMLLAETLAAKR